MQDTIAAIATAAGRAGIGIVRVSGPHASDILRAACGEPPAARVATLRNVRDAAGQVLDEGLVLYFPAPHSYTGEDVFEFQGHGGGVVLNMVLDRLLGLGARRARPGEFTERAFLNGRMDLTQAEAVADLIDASSTKAARAARASLTGAFSRRVDALAQTLTELRVHVEAALDFPEEEIDFLADDALKHRFKRVLGAFDATIDAATKGRRLRDAVSVVIVGAPNAGKSSLLNRLVGSERAIVTDTPGTTRDAIHEAIVLAGTQMTLWDTAGLRASDDAIEQEGMRRTERTLANADIVLDVVDASAVDAAYPTPGAGDHAHRIRVRNKIDLTGDTRGAHDDAIHVSAKTGVGIDALETCLADAVSSVQGEGEFTARQRHIEALHAARAAVRDGWQVLVDSAEGELVAEELGRAQTELAMLTGRVTSDDLLGHIFASFCIGK